jgi:chromosomal replication initiator protein
MNAIIDNFPGVHAERVISLVAESYGVTVSDLKGSSRRKSVVFARQVCMHLIRQDTRLSLDEIAKSLRRLDHSTAICGINRIAELRDTDPAVESEIGFIEGKIRGWV